MLKKILIANRGEIAVRVIRTAKEMGIATVAVYSDLDRNALHVRLADEAFALGGQTATESYLNTTAIIDAIKRSGADAVHPGYGFFSENADFAKTITDMGVVFIGPPPSAIIEMGDKVSSRKAALRGGAPIVPGTTEFLKSADEILEFGNRTFFNALIDELHVIHAFVQYRLEYVFQEGFGQIGVVIQIGKGHFRFDHPELGKMACCV